MPSDKTTAQIRIKYVLMLTTFVLSVLPANSSDFAYSTSKSMRSDNLSANVSIDSIGNVSLPRGELHIQNGKVEIQTITDNTFERQLALSGFLFKTNITTDNQLQYVRSIAYFQSGPMLSEFDDSNSFDIVFVDGGFYRGKIVGISDNKLQINSADKIKNIDISSIRDIRSPRAFLLSAPLISNDQIDNNRIELGSVTLKPTTPSRRLSVQSIKPKSMFADEDDEYMNELDSHDDINLPSWKNHMALPGSLRNTINKAPALNDGSVTPSSSFN